MSTQSFKLTLASQSPRRRQLLAAAGYAFEVFVPEGLVEGPIGPRESTTEYVQRLATQKAGAVAPNVEEGIIIGADTVAECRGRILGKPIDRDDARRMLKAMRGTTHHVYSGVCLWTRPRDRVLVRTDATKLRMAAISDRALEQYLDTGGWKGKAGAFGFQDGLDWIEILHGSETNVVGLPMELLARMLTEMERPV